MTFEGGHLCVVALDVWENAIFVFIHVANCDSINGPAEMVYV